MRKFITALILSGLLSLLAVTAVAAQDTEVEDDRNASIRGTVYMDTNGNGQCVDEDEPTHPGVPIEFVSDDGNWSTFLQTGDDGTYGLVAAAYGTWKVSARPNANDFVVTSEPTLDVFVGEEEPLALGIDFCIQEVDAVAADSGSTTVLPAAGGAFSSLSFVLTALLGVGLLSGGAYLQLRKEE